MDTWVLLIILGRNQRMNEQTATITQFLQGNGCSSSSSPAVAVRRSIAMLWKLVAEQYSHLPFLSTSHRWNHPPTPFHRRKFDTVCASPKKICITTRARVLQSERGDDAAGPEAGKTQLSLLGMMPPEGEVVCDFEIEIT
jgi:hypothetical protein